MNPKRREHNAATPLKTMPWWRSTYTISAIVGAVIAWSLIAWTGLSEEKIFRTNQHRLFQAETTAVSREIEAFMETQIRLVRSFALYNADMIHDLFQDPGNQPLFKKISARLKFMFPDHFTFTITDPSGEDRINDIDNLVGNACKRDIINVSRSSQLTLPQSRLSHAPPHPSRYNYEAYIHPQPFNYHFDVMATWRHAGNGGVFFVSFYPHKIMEILRSYQLPGHMLFVVHKTRKELIEISPDGTRDALAKKRDIRLSAWEKANTVSKRDIQGTKWSVVAVPAPSLFSARQNRIWQRSAMLAAIVAIFLIAVLWWGATVERRRSCAMLDLADAKRRAEHADRAKSDFLAMMSHELRTPMNAILGFSQLMQCHPTAPLPAELTEYNDQVIESGKHLLGLIEDILDLSKIEAGKISLVMETVDMSDVIGKA